MRRPEKTLTARFVQTVKEPGKYFDGHGLFLRVDASGRSYWVQRITVRGKRCEIGIGSPDFVSLATARDLAIENRKLALTGGDPLQARRESKVVPTFEEAARKVHEIHAPSWTSERHAARYLAALGNHVFPFMGKTSVAEITSADLLTVLTPIWLKKPETARRVRQRIGIVMKWAIAKGWRKDNPADAIVQALPRHDGGRENRKALPYAEVFSCLEAIRSSRAGLTTKLALEFLILTAARSGEVRGAVWSEIDTAEKTWAIPAARMKMKRPHWVPLSPPVLVLVERAREISGGKGLVFPGANEGRPLSDVTMSKLVKELGFPVDVHGFRTSFRTWAQEQTEFPREVAEAALAHLVGDTVEQAYARSDLFQKRRAMMDAWAKFVSAIPKGSTL